MQDAKACTVCQLDLRLRQILSRSLDKATPEKQRISYIKCVVLCLIFVAVNSRTGPIAWSGS